MSSKHTGAAERMGPIGPKEAHEERQNAPLRDLHKGGHDLNHSYKNPVAFVSPDVMAAGTNNSYLHPLSHSANMKDTPVQAFKLGGEVKPMRDMGTGKK